MAWDLSSADSDLFMKAVALEGQEASIVTDYVSRILGLDICADTLVGDQMRRGISGGQRKRVTTCEMLVGPAQALFMDEISTGLDSSTTFQIVKCLRQIVHVMDCTMLISLLQPAPETFELFDDVILISEGEVVYQRPREFILDYFRSMGFECPERKSVADFLQEAEDLPYDDKENQVKVQKKSKVASNNDKSIHKCKDFIPSERAIISGVFDGHGPHGHHLSRNVRDTLPAKIASCWQTLQVSSLLAWKTDSLEKHSVSRVNLGGDPDHISLWEETFHNAYKLMDRELLVDEDVDCVFSGTTAVTLVKQGSDLIIANVGDSRAVLGVQFDNSLLALQLTVDLTPNLPKEAERIRRCKGRVLALRKEPFVKRVWLPHENSPGLAMARAFGDYILKNFGVISVPEVTHRRISKNDKFVVLATDGVWDVLSNEQVVRIVDSCPVRSLAAQTVVETAVSAWKMQYPEAKVDDCAVVCLFLDSFTESWQATNSLWY